MSTELSMDVTKELVLPVPEHSQACTFCCGWKARAESVLCDNCVETEEQLQANVVPVEVISLYRKPSNLRDWMTYYKGREGDADAPRIPEHSEILQAILERYLKANEARLFGKDGAQSVLVVPSTSREGQHPLAAVLGQFDLPVPILDCLQRGPGPLGFRRASVDAFEMHLPVPTGGVLLMDDVLTTGARLNSAAAALRAGGGIVKGALVVARRINPDYAPGARELWNACRSKDFTWVRTRRTPDDSR